MDGISTTSRPFTIIPSLQSSSCGAIILDASKSNFQPDSTVLSGSEITLTFKVYDNFGNPYSTSGSVKLIADYIADGPTVLNPEVYQLSNSDGTPGAIVNEIDKTKGSVTLSFKMSGPVGVIYLRARMLSQIGIPNNIDQENNSESMDQLTLSDVLDGTPYSQLTFSESQFVFKVCESDVIRLNFTSPNSIGTIQIDTTLTSAAFTNNISMSTAKNISLTIYNTKGELITNKYIQPSDNFIQVPPYLVGVDKQNYYHVTWNSYVTDSLGKISVR